MTAIGISSWSLYPVNVVRLLPAIVIKVLAALRVDKILGDVLKHYHWSFGQSLSFLQFAWMGSLTHVVSSMWRHPVNCHSFFGILVFTKLHGSWMIWLCTAVNSCPVLVISLMRDDKLIVGVRSYTKPRFSWFSPSWIHVVNVRIDNFGTVSVVSMDSRSVVRVSMERRWWSSRRRLPSINDSKLWLAGWFIRPSHDLEVREGTGRRESTPWIRYDLVFKSAHRLRRTPYSNVISWWFTRQRFHLSFLISTLLKLVQEQSDVYLRVISKSVVIHCKITWATIPHSGHKCWIYSEVDAKLSAVRKLSRF